MRITPPKNILHVENVITLHSRHGFARKERKLQLASFAICTVYQTNDQCADEWMSHVWTDAHTSIADIRSYSDHRSLETVSKPTLHPFTTVPAHLTAKITAKTTL